MSKPIMAWWFGRGDGSLGFGDTRRPRKGRALVHRGELKPCKSGLHASTNILDALKYAPGERLWRVEMSGEVVLENDKLVASRRKHLWCIDAKPVLRKFARMCALDVIDLWDAPDVVVRYLKTGDESIQIAARSAAWAAALGAAQSAARSAACDAARAAACGDAWVDACDAALAAVRARQSRRLSSMVFAEAKELGLI